jgi:hypothetical protein
VFCLMWWIGPRDRASESKNESILPSARDTSTDSHTIDIERGAPSEPVTAPASRQRRPCSCVVTALPPRRQLEELVPLLLQELCAANVGMCVCVRARESP